MLATTLQVALGGAIGASARYLTGVGIARLHGVAGFPLGVLTANVLGSFLMGLLVSSLGRAGLAHLNPFLLTGLLGGFTTFSSFSLEAVTLWERGQPAAAAAYVTLSVGVSIAALLAGLWLGRGVAA
ncbi:fluoride efflux transporter CrcB [Wenxinia marina]|uniref:Fluoride-specific ion channel FluC n=1 Tax=Wenxinia marina DSM 24838 TaxID=1123501 RepID=A0A0D0QEG3_9RHOB|nr:fluoride efflux transporter CrcB [Wenxinia marina]KIQ70712.1 camphor resistance protein CrcB [Wenxinia marina DSM 24838]GGL51190.1 putative fluoride ion transporter CrcB [Wenxinia marina]